MTPYKIRKAAETDIPEIVRVTNTAYEVEHFCIEGDRTNHSDVQARMKSGLFLVAEGAEEPKQIWGTVYITSSNDRGYMGTLSVDPNRQGSGIAKALIAATEEQCRRDGSKFLDITVLDLRTDLFPFYARLGFSPNAMEPFLRPAKIIRPVRLIRMTKPLYQTHEL